MATAYSVKTPPPFDRNNDDYVKWKRRFKVWQSITDEDKKKQGGLLILRLDEETQESIFEALTSDQISSETGADLVIGQLDAIFQKDATVTAYEAYEEFESYKRPKEMTMSEYIAEFEKRWNRTKAKGTALSDNVLAYRMLKSASLSTHQERLVKATLEEVTLETVKVKLKKVFGGEVTGIKNEETVTIKQESEDTDLFYGNRYQGNIRGRGINYNKNNYRGNNRYGTQFRGNSQNQNWRQSYSGRNNANSASSDSNTSNQGHQRKGKNRLDDYGNVTRCWECNSVNHWAKNCPDVKKKEVHNYLEESEESQEQQNDLDFKFDTMYTSLIYELGLNQDDYDSPTKLKNLVSEAFGAAVLDSGAGSTVSGTVWYKNFLEMLSQEERDRVNTLLPRVQNVYKFGDGRKIQAIKRVELPVVIGGRPAKITTDIINEDIPMLLSKNSMKKAGAKLDFITDKITMYGIDINLGVTRSGHYLLPLHKKKQVIIEAERNDKAKLTLAVSNSNIPDIARKLHRQFAHPTAKRLIQLVKHQENSEELIEAIKDVSNKCAICKEYKKPPPRPIVGLPMATRFGECVALDLKQFGKVHLLHLIDHATRYSQGMVIRSKKPEIVAKGIFTCWISVFGTPESFLWDNGGEFKNLTMQELGEKCGIVLKTTAGESPWSNGLVERHNQILGDMIYKTIADTKCSLELAVVWCLSAHNNLVNVHGFSPNQLVFGRNPSIPELLNNNPPALNNETSSDIIRTNLQAMHAARVAYTRSVNDEKVRRALRHNIRTDSENIYVPGDRVYYKRRDSKSWKGPAVVIGRDSQQVLIKHNGEMCRLHPCRLSLEQQTVVGGRITGDTPPKDHRVNKRPSNFITEEEEGNDNLAFGDNTGIREQPVSDNQRIDSQSEQQGYQNDTRESHSQESIDSVNNQDLKRILKEAVQEESPDSIPRVRQESNSQKNQNGRSKDSTDSDSNEYDTAEEKEKNSVNTNSESIDYSSEDSETESIDSIENEMEKYSDSEPESVDSTENEREKNEQKEKNLKEIKKKRGRPPKKRENKNQSNAYSLKEGRVIHYKLNNSELWEKAKLISRAGKAKGIYKAAWNTIDDQGRRKVVDFEREVEDWEIAQSEIIDFPLVTEVMVAEEFMGMTEQKNYIAKLKELESWKKNKVYIEVENEGQRCISAKWILKPKLIDGQSDTKARLVLRGYEEMKSFRTDSPTCNRESVRVCIVILATKKWEVHSADFKTAFLQGKCIEREVYMRPPKEAQSTKLWKLNKTVYGLTDAPRSWYLRLREAIIELGLKVSFLDHGLTYFHLQEELSGILAIFVDDILYAGCQHFLKLVQQLKEKFTISHEDSKAFGYIGISINQGTDCSVSIEQNAYVNSIEPIPLTSERQKQQNSSLTELEIHLMRSKIGQMNWLCGISRPDIGFYVCEASTSLPTATVNNIVNMNKLIRHVKSTPYKIKVPTMKNLESLHLVVYTDASLGNLPCGGSQGGHIVFITDGENLCPIAWHSKKIKRVVKSTLAAETLALLEGCENALMLAKLIGEVIYGEKEKELTVIAQTDNKDLYESAHTTHNLNEKLTQVDMAIVRQMIAEKVITLKWLKSENQLADTLTKRSASTAKLIEVLSQGRL